MTRGFIAGEIATMRRAIAKNGAAFVSLTVVERNRQRAVVIFDERLRAVVEARLGPGVESAFSGRWFVPKGRGDSILVADAALSASGVLRGRGPGEKPPTEQQGALDAQLPLWAERAQ